MSAGKKRTLDDFFSLSPHSSRTEPPAKETVTVEKEDDDGPLKKGTSAACSTSFESEQMN